MFDLTRCLHCRSIRLPCGTFMIACGARNVNDWSIARQGFLVYPLLPLYSQGRALLQRMEGVCWRGCCAAMPAHTLLVSDPRAGREHIGHTMQFRNTKKPCIARQSFAKVARLSEDWPPAAAQEGEQARGAAGRTTCLLPVGVGDTWTTFARSCLARTLGNTLLMAFNHRQNQV